jgi:hypothetical protein
VGGVLTIQNPFIAKARLLSIRRHLPISQNNDTADYIPESYLFENLPVYSPLSKLGNTVVESMRMMADIQKIKNELPGIDCGACGAPNCKAFAEDLVKGCPTMPVCPILQHKKD